MKKVLIIVVVLIVALGAAGFLVYKNLFPSGKAPVKTVTQDDQQAVDTTLPDNTTVSVDVQKSKQKDNAITITVQKLDKKYTALAYEITYDTKGVIQGVNSGSKPIDITDQTDYTKEVYLGTCSKNVCTPHMGVTQVSVALEFTDNSGQKSQFSKDFPL